MGGEDREGGIGGEGKGLILHIVMCLLMLMLMFFSDVYPSQAMRHMTTLEVSCTVHLQNQKCPFAIYSVR